jgi:hypothetical protein
MVSVSYRSTTVLTLRQSYRIIQYLRSSGRSLCPSQTGGHRDHETGALLTLEGVDPRRAISSVWGALLAMNDIKKYSTESML